MRIKTPQSLAIIAILTATLPVQASVVNDATGDYMPTYIGSTVGDLDVITASVSYNSVTDVFLLDSTYNADIGSSPAGFYIWGFNRGSGTARFAANGLPAILFDSVVRLNNDGTGVVTLLTPSISTVSLSTGSVKIDGARMIAEIAANLLPSTATEFTKTDFTWNLWPRDGNVTNNFAQISDFAPDTNNAGVQVVPLPSTFWLFGSVLGLARLLSKRRAILT